MFIFAAAWLAGRVPGEKAFPQPVRAIAGKKNEKRKDMEYDLITILGPTASGKTALAAALACEMHSEVISGDSRQVYRRMDLGTGKDLDDYVVGGTEVPYHLIDIAEPGTKYNVFEFQRDFLDVYSRLRERGIVPILCGGTGLYLESVLRGYRLMPVPENAALREALSEKTIYSYRLCSSRLSSTRPQAAKADSVSSHGAMRSAPNRRMRGRPGMGGIRCRRRRRWVPSPRPRRRHRPPGARRPP